MRGLCYFVLVLILASLVNVSALSLVVHVPEKYTDVMAGERFYFEIDVKYPENPSRKDLRLEYEIVNQDGDLVAHSRVLKAVETQASFIDFIVIPESADGGLHFLNVKVKDYESLSEEVSSSFHVTGDKDQMMLYFFILLGVIVLVGILVVFSIVLRRRK